MNSPPPRYFSDNLRIAFVSRIMKDKGLDVLKQICDKMKQRSLDKFFSIDFYGEIIDDYYEQNLKKEPNMRYCGILDSSRIIPTLKNYDALIFPSHYEGEGCPGILIEGMAAGIPIIASDWKYNSEFVIDGYNGYLCQPLKADDYISAIIRLHEEPATRKRMSLNTKTKSENYSHLNAMSLMRSILNR